MPDLYEESIRHQVMVEGYKEDQINEALMVTPLLLAAFIRDLDGLNANSLRELTYPQLNRFVDRMQANQTKTAAPTQRKIVGNLKDFAGQEFGFQARSLENNDIPAPEPVSDTRAYQEAADTPMSSDGSTLAGFLPFWVAAHAGRMGNTVRRAWADNIPNSDLVTLVRGTRPRRYRDGLLGSQFTRSVRFTLTTAIQHVASSGRLLAMRLSPNTKGYRWASVLDSRTTAICRSLDGRFFEFGKGPRPPAHPGCRSTIVPVLNQEDEAPQRQTYYSWLKRQPKGFQEEVLGKTRTKLFREGGISAKEFADLNLNRYFKPRTLAEMKRLEPLIFERADVDNP